MLQKKITLFFLIIVVISCKDKLSNTPSPPLKEIKKNIAYGFNLDNYNVINDTILKGENFSKILDRHRVSYSKILEIANSVKNIFNVRSIRSGKPYTILATKDSLEKAQIFIYKHSKVNYTVLNFKDSTITAYNAKKPVKTVTKTASGVITSSLSEAMDDLNLDWNLITNMADIYAWTLDFLRLQKNDSFKIIYDEKFINDTIPVGVGDIKAAIFTHQGKKFYAFRFKRDKKHNVFDYFDEEGKNLRRQFLKSPIKFKYRISSRYSLSRKHPVLGYTKAHKGTDFAAAKGTPIIATASGTVIKSERRGGNGNYVKIKHNSTYSTQYLHMSKRKAKVGQYVKQGEVIGYVGSTGLATGPHVCYRFWKYGKQVDPFKQKLPSAKPMNKALKPEYLNFIKPLKEKLDATSYHKPKEEFAESQNSNV